MTTTHQLHSTDLQTLLLINEALGEKQEKIFRSVMTASKGDKGERQEVFARYEQIQIALSENVIAIIGHSVAYGTNIISPSGCDLQVADVTAHGKIVLTSDGLPVQPMVWHKGVETEPIVRYERWDSTGMVAHGFCDPVSRNLVQSG